jgi:hypothetical protein
MNFSADIGTRRKRLVMLFALFALGAALLGACGDKKMMTNTKEYSKAHGIVEGRTNELRIKGVLFHFPPQYLPNPYSANKIVNGRADRATIHMDFSKWLNPVPTAHSEYIALVRVEIWQMGYEDDKKIEEQFATEKWKSIQDRPDLGLREFIRSRDDGGWGYRTYESLDPKFKTPKGGRIVFDCSGLAGQYPNICRTVYQHPRGPLISYYLAGQLLPRWREVNAEVVKLINSLIVE